MVTTAARDDDKGSNTGSQQDARKEMEAQLTKDNIIVYSIGLALAAVMSFLILNYGEQVQDYMLYGGLESGGSVIGGGDVLGAVLWGVALFYTSPLQLLLLFLGEIDTERPSDWLLQRLGRAAGLPVDTPEYVAPKALVAAVAGLCGAAGVATAAVLETSLGDATWAVSSGLGACIAAGVYEVGRPTRLSKDQAVELEAQWQDFAVFANKRLQRSGRCHESEVYRVFRQTAGRYRTPEGITDLTLRSLVRQWHPDAQRTPGGYYKNLSLRTSAPELASPAGTGIGTVSDVDSS